MGGKTSKDETEAVQTTDKVSRDVEDAWFNTLTKQEKQAKYDTMTKRATKGSLKSIFTGKNDK